MDIKKEIVEKIPFNPGVYLMKDENDNIIYVGKAKSLRKRVRQYFNKTNKTNRILSMVSKIRNIEYIVVENELEALALECNYIKEFKPKYNVMLKDDKTYPYIKITVQEEFPAIYITRKYSNDGAKYFGPYTDVGALKSTYSTLKEIFPIKRCKYNFNKKINSKVGPCLYYHIGRCLGPCINDIEKKAYKSMINEIILFLEGKTDAVSDYIKKQIDIHISKLEFEKAAVLKERLDKLKNILSKQNVSNLNESSTDIFGYIKVKEKMYIQIFKIRNNKLVNHDNIYVEDIEEIKKENVILDVISQYYTKNMKDIPSKLYLKLKNENKYLEEIIVLQKYLNSLKKAKIEIHIPKKGSKLKLVQMIERNIIMNIEQKKENPLELLKQLLNIDINIDNIECYDISNLRDSFIVGASITYEDGKLNKNKYRKYKIMKVKTQNDVSSMKEVISRRLKHIANLPLPDIFLIDGGKNQVNAVREVLKENKLDTYVVGMIKDSKHRTRGIIDLNNKEIDFRKKTEYAELFKLITKLQDEVHRFVITYHRKLRDEIK